MPRTKDEARRGINGPPLRVLATMAVRKTARPPEPENVSDESTRSSSSDDSISGSSSDDEERCKKDMAYDSLDSIMSEVMSTFKSLSMTAKLDLDHEAIEKKASSILEALKETQKEADKRDRIKRKRKGRPRTKEEVMNEAKRGLRYK